MKKVFYAVALLFAGSAQAVVIDFESAYDDLDYRADPADYYLASGLTIEGTNAGLIPGVSRGDAGGFALEGTNGAAALGVNKLGHTIDLFFGTAVDLTLDYGVSFGQTANVKITTYLEGGVLGQSESTFTDTLDNGSGTWSSLGWLGVDRVRLEASSGWRSWGIDNLQFGAVSVPEPGSFALLALGLVGLGLSAGKRAARRRSSLWLSGPGEQEKG